MNQSHAPAIVIGGRAIGLAVIRSLGKKGVKIIFVYYDKKDFASGSKYISKKIFAPHPEKDEADFIKLILSFSNEFQNAVIYPADDESLLTISKNEKILKQYFKVVAPDFDVVNKIVDKKYTYMAAEKIGIPCPKTIVPKNINDVIEYSKNVMFPCLIKPSKSHLYVEKFAKKMSKVETEKELIAEYKKAVDAKIEVMIQEYIPGKDDSNFSYWCYSSEGNFFIEATAQKVRNDPPETGSPRVQITKDVKEIIPYGRKILKELNYNGYACTEFKKDIRDGQYKFMEINGRVNLCIPQAIKGGIDYPWLIYRHKVYKELPKNLRCKEGIYWIDAIRDILRSIQYRKFEKYKISEYIKPYLSPHVFAIFSLRDIKPFLKRLINIVKLIFTKESVPSILIFSLAVS